ncbi:MAG TPA: hypothetical protein VGK10_14030 [Prolixibacteraceae bacterium]
MEDISQFCKFERKMGHEALKLELIEWLMKLEDEDTIDYLKIVKDANVSHDDWGHDLTDEQTAGIERGLKDVDEGRVTPHDIVKRKYGL